MKKMRTLNFGFVLGLCLGFCLHGGALGAPSAAERTEIAVVRAEIATAVRQIVREIDPSAVVTVRLIRHAGETKKLKLPGAPFLSEDISVSPSAADNAFSTVDVTIFSTSGTLPDAMKKMIREVVGEYSQDVKFNIKALPSEIVDARKNTDDIKAKPWEAPLHKLLTLVLDLTNKGQQIPFRKVLWGLLTLIGVAALIVSLMSYLWFSAQRKIFGVMERGFRDIKTALDSGGGGAFGSGIRDLPAAQLPQQKQRQLQATLQGAGNGSHSFATMPEASLLALLSDCYWCDQDHYGAFLWRRIPTELKIVLIERMPELSEYGRYLSALEEEDLGVDQDPSYLKPLPLWNINMETLTEIVRGNKGLITKLSPLRLAALQVRPTERLALYELSEKGELQAIPALPNQKSPPRTLKQALRISIQSEEDEVELLSINEPAITLIEQVPSLGWLLRLPDDVVADILKSLSAKDIASAWVGPENVLNKLSPLVGDKKLEIVKSHLTRLTPSRDSSAFAFIHQRAVEELQRLEKESHASGEELKHAS